MKRMFHNSVGKNTAVITCENRTGIFKLHFHLYDNPVQHIWQEIHLNNKNIITGIHQGENFDTLLEKLNYNCSQGGIKTLEKPITQKKLNWLHNQFVLSKKSKYWDEINHLIHRLEIKINSPLSDFNSSVKFYAEKEKFIPIKEEYKIFLNTKVSWGNLELGYGTLGKDWLDISYNNDDDTDLAIQNKISSETRLVFSPEQITNVWEEQEFYKWAKHTHLNVPIDNLNSLSLGRYILGQIIITDTLLNFHNIPNDWYVPNHKCKLLWNREIFTSDTKIIKIEFKNTNLLFETVTSHAKFWDLNV
jgi:hypothetical protein